MLFICGFKNLILYSLSLATYAVTVILLDHTKFPIKVPACKKCLVHNVMWKAYNKDLYVCVTTTL